MKVLKYQQWTLLFLIIFSIIFFFILPLENFQQGEFWGIPTIFWAVSLIIIIIIHQIYVLLSWRLEMHYSLITKTFGKLGFPLHVIVFFILLILRIHFTLALSLSNAGTLTIPFIVRLFIVLIMSIPMLYTFYSVLRYFGLYRAAGGDHFFQKYREGPFVKKGIYKFTSNALYIFGFLIFWIPPLLFGSLTALLIALFSQIFIWVHYFTIEKPDIKFLYKNNKAYRILR
ncbi:MAG: hypothetical protein EU540_07575 [Promethearchaeota archaeon]|nr:MAG: hypothetical protein EU540_07575 [Candidatus Lokiarchaeota archaeon]